MFQHLMDGAFIRNFDQTISGSAFQIARHIQNPREDMFRLVIGCFSQTMGDRHGDIFNLPFFAARIHAQRNRCTAAQ